MNDSGRNKTDRFIQIIPKDGIKLPPWKRAVIKVGSGLVTAGGNKCSTKYLLDIASFIIECRNRGKEIILVSSGAVAAGLSTQTQLIGKTQRSIPEKQALAAIGQSLLMAIWSRLFDFPCAQLLLTYDDIYNRKRFVNAKNTLMELLNLKTLPIINENDTVAVDELKVGDNDNLAAYVAVLAGADLFLICSDVDGLFDADPRKNAGAQLLNKVEKIDDKIYKLAGGTQNTIATGGMLTKIQAAEKATSGGINTIIMNGTKRGFFELLLNDIICGTIFIKSDKPVKGKKHWMLHAKPSLGDIFIDQGAVNAISTKGASLLPSGIQNIKGRFAAGDAVNIIHVCEGQTLLVAKGISQYGSDDLKKIIGKKSKEIESVLNGFYSDVVVSRDEMVLKK
ncbi:glutamate 5-kinase [candidate division KSB1 bacterium]|nr:glutamate 5-kinase [candidate division KSB1 bacterium]